MNFKDSVDIIRLRPKIEDFVTTHHSQSGIKKESKEGFSFKKVELKINFNVSICLHKLSCTDDGLRAHCFH